MAPERSYVVGMTVDGEHPLDHALRKRHVEFAFQPVLDLRTGEISYAEALVRLNHPQLGRLPPSRLLPLVDTIERADRFTAYSLELAVEALPLLRSRYGNRVRVGVNLSDLQLKGDAANLVVEAARNSDGDSEWLTVEIVEDLVVDDLQEISKTLEACRASGARVLLDDFGTGTTTLAMLTELGYDGLKIDRRYISAINTSTQARLLVESLIRFGHGANVDVIAEGVETAEIANELRRMHCQLAQGFHVGVPLTVDEITDQQLQCTTVLLTSDGVPDELPSGLSASDDMLIIDLRERLTTLQPMTSALSYDTLVDGLDRLELAIESVVDVDARLDLYVSCRHRRLLCFVLAAQLEALITQGLDLADFCERNNRPVAGALALSLVAGHGQTSLANTEQRQIAADALARLLQIRAREEIRMDLESLTRLDLNIGIVFAHLGLYGQASSWWMHNFRRAGTLKIPAVDLTRWELIEHLLGRNEVRDIGVEPDDADLVLLHELLAVPLVSDADPGAAAHAAFQCRELILRGELSEATDVFDAYRLPSASGFVEEYVVLWTNALLARAENDAPAFLRSTTALVDASAQRGLFLLYQRRIDRLHAEALAANGHYKDAFEFTQHVVATEAHASTAAIDAAYGWLQSPVAGDRPFLPPTPPMSVPMT